MGLSRSDLLLLMDAFESSKWTEMVLSLDRTRLELTSTGRPPQSASAVSAANLAEAAVPPPAAQAASPSPAASPAVAPAAPPGPTDAVAVTPDTDGLHEVRAPSVGIFYRAPAPDAPPFVSEGDHVEPDDIVCIVEVMKLMNHVKAAVSGVVRTIHVENATMIEHGQLLFTIDSAT